MNAAVSSNVNVAPQATSVPSPTKLSGDLPPSDSERFLQIMQEFADAKAGAGPSDDGKTSAVAQSQSEDAQSSLRDGKSGASLTELISDAVASSAEKQPTIHGKDKKDRRAEADRLSLNTQDAAAAFSNALTQFAQSGVSSRSDLSAGTPGRGAAQAPATTAAISGPPESLDETAGKQDAAGLYSVIETKTHLAVVGAGRQAAAPRAVPAVAALSPAAERGTSHSGADLTHGKDPHAPSSQRTDLKDPSHAQSDASSQITLDSALLPASQATQAFGFGALAFGGPTGVSGPIAVSNLPQTVADLANGLTGAAGPNPADAGQASQAVKEIRLSLTPADLGAVSVHMRLGAAGLDVTIAADHQQAVKHIDGLKDSISNLLASGGQHVNTVIVKAAEGSSSSVESSYGQNGQANAQGSGASWGGAGRSWTEPQFQRGGQSKGEGRSDASTLASSPAVSNDAGPRADGLFI